MKAQTSIHSTIFNKNRFKHLKKFLPLYIMFIPVLIYYLVFLYLPMGGIIIAFKNYNLSKGILASEWVGLRHFERFITNGDCLEVFKNTIILASYRILFGFPAPIIFAILLNELRFSMIKRFIQTVSYLPHFISWVVVYGLLYNYFSSQGLINQILGVFNIAPIPFLILPKYFRALFVGSAIWKEVGWNSIIFFAALSNIDIELYQAAIIDGANRWKRMIYITIPSIRTVVGIMLILSFGGILSVSFEQVLVMINPGVSSVAKVIDYYVYQVGLLQPNNFGYATAVGLFRSIIGIAVVLVANFIAKKIEEDAAIW